MLKWTVLMAKKTFLNIYFFQQNILNGFVFLNANLFIDSKQYNYAKNTNLTYYYFNENENKFIFDKLHASVELKNRMKTLLILVNIFNSLLI